MVLYGMVRGANEILNYVLTIKLHQEKHQSLSESACIEVVLWCCVAKYLFAKRIAFYQKF